MTVNPLIRDIFSRFQNLNLLTLMNNLRLKRVAFGGWQDDDGTMCPLSHGLGYQTQHWQDDLSKIFSISYSDIRDFVWLWDAPDLILAGRTDFLRRQKATNLLLRQLETIWQERLEDAEAMQEVLQAEPAQLQEAVCV